MATDEELRLRDLREYDILNTPREAIFDEITELACHMFGTPAALITLIDEQRQWVKSSYGLHVGDTPRKDAFCNFAIRTPSDVMVIGNAAADDRFCDNPLVSGGSRIRFYAGAPLVTENKQALGTLCILDFAQRDFDERQRRSLKLLASQVVQALELRKKTKLLAQRNAIMRTMIQRVPGMLYQYQLFPDGRACFPYTSDGIEKIYGLRHEDVAHNASRAHERIVSDDAPRVVESIAASAKKLERWECEYRVRLPDAGVRWLHGVAHPERQQDSSVIWHGYIHDITERKEEESRTQQLAYYDTLTGLPNRALLADRLEVALLQARRTKRLSALLFLDLDKFKQINDTRGHSFGDKVLIVISKRLKSSLRASDTVGRLGGDEFLVLLNDLSQSDVVAAAHAEKISKKLLSAISEPIDLDGHSYTMTCSIGICIFPDASESVDDVMRKADIAMYRVKAGGRNDANVFERSMQLEVQRTISIEEGLRKAIDRGELFLEVQSQVDAQKNIVGGECLLRWKSLDLGSVPPSRFIPIAEEEGLIIDIGDWVMEEACHTLIRSLTQRPDVSLSVNVSVKQIQSPDFITRVRNILARTKAPANRLVFEVTEGLFIGDINKVRGKLDELVQMGIKISIDDFGTGYSSLRYLQRFPIGELKIDRSFVKNLPNDTSDVGIVRMIASMSKHLGLHLVAEGVENIEHFQWLSKAECDSMQGFYFDKPASVERWIEKLASAQQKP